MKNKIRALVAISASAVALVACNGNNFRDVEGVNSHDPDKIEVYSNVDENPNVVRLCIDGVAIMTTTREYGDAVTLVPAWDAWCGGAG